MRHRIGRKMRRGALLNQPRPDWSLAIVSTARRFARSDRRGNPVYCEKIRKLMYDSEEIARSTGQAIERIAGPKNRPQYLYQCPGTSHWHLTSQSESREGVPNGRV